MRGTGCRTAPGVCVALLAFGAACSSSKPPAHKGTVGDLCSEPDECASGLLCASISNAQICTVPCASNADCPAGAYLECGVLADGSRVCVPECYLNSGLPGFACVDGVPTACELLGDEHCESCGCAAGLTCLTGTACVPPSDVGGPCDADDDCVSNNCSTFAGVCRVRLGTPCTTSDCDYCLAGWYCSRECRSETGCQGGRCLGELDAVGRFTGVYYCRPPCQLGAAGPCPDDCEYHTDAQYYYCACSHTTCVGTHAPHTIGQFCRSDAQCPRPAYCLGSDSGGGLRGYCSAPCTSSAECGAGVACSSVGPCAPGETCDGLCRPLCDATSDCEIGACNQRIDTAGTTMGVCE